MSALTSLLSELFAADDVYQIARYCQAAACAFTLYDWCLSLPREARVFWKVPPTLAACLYHAVRWSIALNSISVVVAFSSYSVKVSDTGIPHSCDAIAKLSLVTTLVQGLSWASFSALRAHALSQHRVISILVFVLYLAPVGNAIAESASNSGFVTYSQLGCLPQGGIGASGVIAVTRMCLVVADIVLIVITWRATGTRGCRAVLTRRYGGVSSAIFRDGDALMLLNLIEMCIAIYSESQIMIVIHHSTLLGVCLFASVFTSPIASVLISHFLLDLQEASRRAVKLGSEDPLYSDRSLSTSALRFSSLGMIAHPEFAELTTVVCADGTLAGQECGVGENGV
ncbi:hypothetical protein BD311DRAFT_760553 [Dichomitus squalens]|uniref:DUF6533 domain-containing protein n=1 Tax=Dichomitus squalens TaxID=114155 RepID=A0A4Q9MIS5_9APHY|nr:hypothetical protein BD311DRAFT_760553 [Dichomitus squalens]